MGVVPAGRGRRQRGADEAGRGVIKIAISEAAFEAISATLPLGSVAYEPELNAKGERSIWLEPAVLARLRAMRGGGETSSEVILRLVAHAGDETESA